MKLIQLIFMVVLFSFVSCSSKSSGDQVHDHGEGSHSHGESGHTHEAEEPKGQEEFSLESDTVKTATHTHEDGSKHGGH